VTGYLDGADEVLHGIEALCRSFGCSLGRSPRLKKPSSARVAKLGRHEDCASYIMEKGTLLCGYIVN
jgi:hypothetical protein